MPVIHIKTKQSYNFDNTINLAFYSFAASRIITTILINIKMKFKAKTEIISNILNPALKLWLKSQLDHVDDLKIKISATDNQLLKGKINQVFLDTNSAIYQGIYVRKVLIQTENIAINIGEIVRGKSLKLLQPIFVNGELKTTEQDLNNSLNSDLLSQGLTDLVNLFLSVNNKNNGDFILENNQIKWEKLTIANQKFNLIGNFVDSENSQTKLIIKCGLALENPHTLLLNPVYIEGIPTIDNFILNNFTVDLGDQVELDQINLSSQELHCMGKVQIKT